MQTFANVSESDMAGNPYQSGGTCWKMWRYGFVAAVNANHDDRAGIAHFQQMARRLADVVQSHAVKRDLRDAYKAGRDAGLSAAFEMELPFTLGNGKFRTSIYEGSDQNYAEVMSEMGECRMNAEQRLWARY